MQGFVNLLKVLELLKRNVDVVCVSLQTMQLFATDRDTLAATHAVFMTYYDHLKTVRFVSYAFFNLVSHFI